MPDLEISNLFELSGTGLAQNDVVALADISASETKKITAKNFVQAAMVLIDPASIPYDKVNTPASTLPDGSVTNQKIADGAVTDIKIAGVNGSKIANGSITGDKFGAITDRGLDVTGGNIGITNSVASASLAGISWNAQGLVTGAVSPIPAADLPIATDVTPGVVSVPAAGGLVVSGTGEIEIGYKTSANSVANITYNDFGQIMAVSNIQSGHLPVATTNEIGAVKFPLSQGLLVDGDGNVTLSDTGVTAGTYTKLTVDSKGRAIIGGLLDPIDIPNLDAGRITSGEFPGSRIQDGSITAPKLGPFSTVLMQEGNPGPGAFLGQLWLTPSTNQLRVYGGGSGQDVWLPVGFGSLQARNLRWGGVIDAANSTITALTDIGTSEGLTIGSPIPAATDASAGLYFVVSTGGNGINLQNVSTDSFTPGDWLLSAGDANGYLHIDVTATGGGGGGSSITSVNGQLGPAVVLSPADIGAVAAGAAITQITAGANITVTPGAAGEVTIAAAGGSLDALSDVTVTTPIVGQFLVYGLGGWSNQAMVVATSGEVLAGIDTTKPVTSDTIKAHYLQNIFATSVEVGAGTVTDKPISSDTLKANYLQKLFANSAEVVAGTITDKPVAPDMLKANYLSNVFATSTEVKTGTNAVKPVASDTLKTNYLQKDISQLGDLP